MSFVSGLNKTTYGLVVAPARMAEANRIIKASDQALKTAVSRYEKIQSQVDGALDNFFDVSSHLSLSTLSDAQAVLLKILQHCRCAAGKSTGLGLLHIYEEEFPRAKTFIPPADELTEQQQLAADALHVSTAIKVVFVLAAAVATTQRAVLANLIMHTLPVMAPLAVGAALKFANSAEKKLSAAREYEAEVKAKLRKLKQLAVKAKHVRDHIREYTREMIDVEKLLTAKLLELRKIIDEVGDSGELTNSQHRVVFCGVFYTMVGRKMLTVPIIEDSGNLNPDSMTLLEHVRNLPDTENIDRSPVIQALVDGQPIDAYVNDDKTLESVRNSELYFWANIDTTRDKE